MINRTYQDPLREAVNLDQTEAISKMEK